jgi:prolipoprotein diacylglyceryltransferase
MVVPVLFRVWGYEVGTHDFFVLLGVAAASVVFFHEARRRGMLCEELVWIVVGTLFCGALAARASTLWGGVAEGSQVLTGDWVGGTRSILGGFTGAYLGALGTKRIVGYRQKTGDLFAPAVALGMAIGRWGCFLTEQIGAPTSLPWGIRVSSQAAAHIPNCPACSSGAPMHPSFLYEIAFHAVMFGVLLWLRPRVHVNGELLKIYLLTYALFRFAVEFVRGNEAALYGLTRSQLFLIPSSALLLVYFWRQYRRGAYISATALPA